MLKDSRTHFKNIPVLASQDFKSMYGQFSLSFMEGLMDNKFRTIELYLRNLSEITCEMRQRSNLSFLLYVDLMQQT